MADSQDNHNPAPRVLILTHLFYPELVATGQNLTELGEGLANLGVDIEVICAPPTILGREEPVPKFLVYHGMKIRRVWATNFPKLFFLGMLLNHLSFAVSAFFYLLFHSSHRPLLVVTNPPFLGIISALLKLMKGTPFIYLVHDVYPDTPIKLGVMSKNGLVSKVWVRLNRFILKQAAEIIVIGRCMQGIILEKGGGGDNLSQKVRMIPVWGDERNIQPVRRDENPFIKKWNLEGKFVVSYSGNMGRAHDMETIMAAAKEMAGNPDIVFVFIGDGYKKKWMKKYAQTANLTNCQFHNYVDRADLRYSISCAHVGLVSLLPGQEGLSVPSKVFSLLCAGVPAIGIMTPKSEIAAVIKENDCGLVVEPGDVKGLVIAINKLYQQPEIREKKGWQGREAISRKYNLEKSCQKYKSVISELQF